MKLPEYIFHLAEASNWPNIKRNGLFCAHQLVIQAETSRSRQNQLTICQRTSHTILSNGVEIRDQRPMPPNALLKCLINISPSNWYRLINSHVFFWLDIERLNRQKNACEPRPQLVLTFKTSDVIDTYRKNIFVTPINTGYALRKAAKRGKASFVSYEDWLKSGWKRESEGLTTRKRSLSHMPVELAVRGRLSNADKIIENIQPLQQHEKFAC